MRLVQAVVLDPFVKLSTKIPRGHAFEFMKTAVKIRHIIKADLETNIGNLLIGFSEQATGAADTYSIYKLDKAVAGGFFEKPGKVTVRHANQASDIGKRDVLAIVEGNIIHNRVDFTLQGFIRFNVNLYGG